jgi:hypothetical protein
MKRDFEGVARDIRAGVVSRRVGGRRPERGEEGNTMGSGEVSRLESDIFHPWEVRFWFRPSQIFGWMEMFRFIT